MPKPENIIGKGFDKRPQNINKNGRPPKLPALDELMAKVMGEMGESGLTAMEAILKAQRSKAAKGDTRAAELLLDRAYGKAKQSIDLSNEDGSLNNLGSLSTEELIARAEALKALENK
jgi:hypothetical protein